jgi:hypothetical protein
MRKGALFERLSTTSAAAQASVPGMYAWAVTVAPTAWGRGTSPVAKIASVVALLMLAANVLSSARSSEARDRTNLLASARSSEARDRTNLLARDGWWGRHGVGSARAAFLWGFVVASAVVWATAPNGLGPLRVDAPRGLAGMLAWALFAFASAAPVVETRFEESDHPAEQASLFPRRRMPKGALAYVATGALFAAVLQAQGWRIASAERALLLRLIGLATGLAVIGAMTQIGLLRHVPRETRTPAGRLRRALAALVVLGILMLSGLLMFVLD